MFRIPPNSKVRRRLFFEDTVEGQATLDNFANVLQEQIAKEREENKKKYNFDFKDEKALEGRYQWWKKIEDVWELMETKQDVPENDKSMPKKMENETTPMHVRDESVPIIRKRRKDIENNTGNLAVKRKVDFDKCSLELY